MTFHNDSNTDRKKILILLETELQVNDCLAQELSGEKIIIALSPFAMYELDRKGIKYKIPEEYYSPQDLYSLGMANFQRIEDLCDIMDNCISRWCKEAGELKIRPALFIFYSLKMIYDAMTIRIFQLSNIFDIEKPDVIYIHDSRLFPFRYKNDDEGFFRFDNRDSLYSKLLKLDGWKKEIIFFDIESNNEPELKPANSPLFHGLKKYIFSKPDISNLAMIIKKDGLKGIFFWIKYLIYSKERKHIGLLGGGYNWDDSLKEILSEKIGPIYHFNHGGEELFNNNNQDINLNNAWNELYSSRIFIDFFSFMGIDFLSILKERLEFIVKRSTKACIKTEKDMEGFINKNNIKAVISSVIATSLDHSAAKAAHNQKVPVITWQHGAYGAFHHQIINYLDLISSDYHFVFGDGVKEQYTQQAISYGTKIVSTGSAALDRLAIKFSRERQSESRKILYITAAGYQNHLYISHYPPFSDNYFWQTQKAIIDTLGKHPEYSIIMKLHPTPYYRKLDFKSYTDEKKYSNFEFIMNEKSTEELLLLADTVILDIPSTVLLQSLTTSKPVFVYMGHARFDPAPLQLLMNRAVCHENLEEFILKLEDYLTNKNYSKDLSNKDYLLRFGTYLDKGFASRRAAEALRQIIDKNF